MPGVCLLSTRLAYGPRFGDRAPRGTGEPPLLADPRRWGSLIGLVGVVAALFAHYIRPVPLGPLARPRPRALATYCASVVGALALIAVGFRALSAQGPGELRPDAMAVVAGIAMLVMITLYALGRFVRPSAESPVD